MTDGLGDIAVHLPGPDDEIRSIVREVLAGEIRESGCFVNSDDGCTKTDRANERYRSMNDADDDYLVDYSH